MQVSRKRFYAFLKLLSCFALAALMLPGPGVEASTTKESVETNLSSSQPPLESQLLLTSYSDPDFDGITTQAEQAGWFNSLGGPFVTNPNLNDSDGDGLLDGAEQIFDTNPLDNKSPGIFVQYQDSYRTSQYFGWNRHGSRYISHGEAAIPALVVRRGSKVVVGGPPDATLSVSSVSGGGITSLNASKNSCAGGWTINVPANGTAGQYRLTMQAGGWSDALDLYVIFNIPNNLPDSQVASFLYDDNSADLRDEISVWFFTSETPANSPDHKARGVAYAFYNQQFEEWLLKDHVMNAISGKSSVEAAASALTRYLDSITRFNNNSYSPNMKRAIQVGDGNPDAGQGAQCSNIANMLAGFNRAAGIPARPFLVDWDREVPLSGNFDHATEIYLGNSWRVYRGYNVPQGGETPPLPISGGIVENRTKTQWGGHYDINRSDIMIAGGPDWNFNHVSDLNDDNPNDSLPGRGTGREYEWDNNRNGKNNPCEIIRHNWVEIPVMEYWGSKWNSKHDCNGEPKDVGDPSGQNREAAPLTAAETGAETAPVNLIPGVAQFTGAFTDAGVDANSNGRFDKLVVQLQVEAFQAGNYFIGASLADGVADPSVNDGIQDVALPFALNPGLNTISLEFGGLAIGENEVDGPYTLANLWISNAASLDPIALQENLLDYRAVAYTTNAYKATSFEQFGADLSGSYTHNVSDQNGDGYMDRLVINTSLNIVTPGSYSVEAELTDSQGEKVATATWSGSDGQVSLQFDALLSQMTPYLLSSINLYDANGTLIDYAQDRAGIYSAGPFYSLGLSAASVVTPTVTSVSTPDSDGNGKFDSLDFNVSLSIAVPGNYRLEGWLEAGDGTLLSWQTSAPTALGLGTQNLTLSFPGQAINNFRLDGPYTLTALKVLFNGGYQPIDEIPVAYETSAYGFGAFQAGFDASAYILIDRGVDSNWSSNGTEWGLTASAASSPLFSWTDSPNGSYGNGSQNKLTSKSFNITNGAIAQLSFQTCYNIGTGDQGQIEVNLPGGWQSVPGTAYSGDSNGWSQQTLFLPPVIGTNNLAFRFILSADNSGSNPDGWYVDDTFVKLDYDLDDDGIGNAVEAVTDAGVAPPPYPDTDGDGTPDYSDPETDGDGIPDSIEGAGDADGDGQSNFRDLDADGDGRPDSVEGTGDSNNNGIPNFLDNPNGSSDSDGDTISNTQENIPGFANADGDQWVNAVDPDSDNDGISDEVEAGDNNLNTPPADTDSDGLPDFIDNDSDNDSLPDSQEGPGDLDNDGIPDYQDTDRDGDGMPDRWETDHELDPSNDDSNLDPDGDGLNNGDEYDENTNPRDPDTDNDGQLDGDDPTPAPPAPNIFLPIIGKSD